MGLSRGLAGSRTRVKGFDSILPVSVVKAEANTRVPTLTYSDPATGPVFEYHIYSIF